jgi:DNA-binding response OmpR family regulator
MKAIKLLLVEDEQVLAMVLKETLEGAGFSVTVAANGVQAWSLYKQWQPDACIADIMLPKKDGISLVQDIRTIDSRIPIIFLTAKTQTEDVLNGLKAGADDYIKKPFSMEELIMRLQILLRRVYTPGELPALQKVEVTVIGSYRFDYTRMQLTHNNEVFYLSQREADLLQMLFQQQNQLLDRRTALLQIWGEDSVFHARTMDVYITKLRKYLKNDSNIGIVNVRGKGYKLII